MAWPIVPLNQLCKQDRVSARSDIILPYVGMDQVASGGGEITLTPGSRSGDGKGTCFLFDNRHVLYGKLRPYLNKVALPDFVGKCSTELVPLLPNDGVERSFLAYLLRRKLTVDHVMATATGARMPRASMDVLLALPVPLPPISEQHRIVDILDRAAAIQRLRKEAEKKAREFSSALFVDMFGDPVTNAKGWAVAPLLQVALISSGITKGRKLDSARTIHVPYLRVANVQDGFLALDEIKTIEILENEKEKYALKMGDLVMTEGGDMDKLGRGFVWEENLAYCAHQNHIFRVRPDTSRLNSYFLSSLVQSWHGKSYFLKVAKRTTGIASINKTQLGQLPVWLPPISLQLTFAERVATIVGIERLVSSTKKLVHEFNENLAPNIFG